MGKEVNYIAVNANNNIAGNRLGNPLDDDLFYDDAGSTIEFSNACGGEYKSGADAATVQAGLTAVGQLAGTLNQGKSDVKQACGNRPLFARNRGTYDACVKKYNAGTLKGKPQIQTKDGTSPAIVNTGSSADSKTKSNTTTYVIVAAAIVAAAAIWYFKNKGNKGK